MKQTLAIIALIGTLLANVKHAAAVYLLISPVGTGIPLFDWCYAVFVVLCLDASVFVFTLQGNTRAAIVFAAALCVISLIYYTSDGEWTWEELVGIVCFSGLFAYASYAYADLFGQRDKSHTIVREKSAKSPQLPTQPTVIERDTEPVFLNNLSNSPEKSPKPAVRSQAVAAASDARKADPRNRRRYLMEKKRTKGLSDDELIELQSIQ